MNSSRASAGVAGLTAVLIVLPAIALMLGPSVIAMPYWLACAACVIIAVIARAMAETWLHPAPLVAAVWALFYLFPSFVVTSLYPAPMANSYIVLAVAVATLPAAQITAVRAGEAQPRRVRTARYVRWLVLLGGLTGIVAAMLAARNAGLPITTPFSIQGLRRAGLAISVARYTGRGGQTPPEVLLMAVTFTAATLAPFAAAQVQHRLRRLLLTVWPLAGAVLFSVATTARAGMLIAATLTLSSWFLVHSLAGAGRARIKFRAVFGAVVATLVLASVVVFAAFSRVTAVTGETRLAIYGKLGAYVGGSIPAFNFWLTYSPHDDGLPWLQRFGGQTFAGLRGLNGGGGGKASTDFVPIDSDSTSSTNVFTLFRSLITDFGVLGSLLFLFVASIVAAAAWRSAVITGNRWPVIITIAFTAAGLFSSTSSLLVFTNTCAALILAAVVLAVGCRFPTDEDLVREQREADQREAERLAMIELARARRSPRRKATAL